MKFLGVALGLMVANACSMDTGDVTSDIAPDPFGMLRVTAQDQGANGLRSPLVGRAIGAAAARILALQADTIGDNAQNGLDDTDPDDGGWDFIVAPSATQHSPAASPTNLYGNIGLAEWAAVVTGSAGDRALTSALDAGAAMQRDPDIDSAPDFVFGVLLAELANDLSFATVARQHYDAKLAARGGATGMATLIRDARHASHEDGLIPYDVGWFVLAATALDAAFPGAGYDRDADTFAGVVVDDLTAATPLFDFTDPTEGNYITGLAWAQVASARLHDTVLFAQLRTQLLDQQHADGAWGASAAQAGDDLQSTAHALQTLALTDQSTQLTRRAIHHGARWLLQGQATSGGWVDAAGNELPLVDADIVVGLMLSRTTIGLDGLIPGAPLVATPRTAATPTSRAAPQL